MTHSSVHYIYHVVHYIPSTYNWKFVPFDCLHVISPPYTLLPLVTTNLIFFSYEFYLFLMTSNTMLVPVIQHVDLIFLYISK